MKVSLNWIKDYVKLPADMDLKKLAYDLTMSTVEVEDAEELAKKFINKECLIYAFDSSHQFEGVIKEVTDGAILVEKAGTTEAINLDFVIRIREFPKNKKGKKKSVVLD